MLQFDVVENVVVVGDKQIYKHTAIDTWNCSNLQLTTTSYCHSHPLEMSEKTWIAFEWAFNEGRGRGMLFPVLLMLLLSDTFSSVCVKVKPIGSLFLVIIFKNVHFFSLRFFREELEQMHYSIALLYILYEMRIENFASKGQMVELNKSACRERYKTINVIWLLQLTCLI